MRRNIPSSRALVAFEAAGRHESFTLAAQEINLTEGAVSRQIGRLETSLGVKLFARVKNRVHLTTNGRIYWEQICSDIERLERHTLNLQAHPGDGGILELAVIPTFNARWLIPRLHDFTDKSQGIKINMTELTEPFIFANSSIDAALHYDHPAWVGMFKVDLFAEELVPVCSPRLCGGSPLVDLNELKKFPLLHHRGRLRSWQNLSVQLELKSFNPMAGTRYALFLTIIEAARAGLGIGLVPKLYVTDELARGELIIPFDSQSFSEKRYCLIYPERMHESPPLNTFVSWLKNAAHVYKDES